MSPEIRIPGRALARRLPPRRRRVRAIQADMVGGVTLAEDDPPGVVARRDSVALGERREVGR